MSSKSVLIVTYGFPPHIKSLGGAIRMLKLAEYLQRSGCNVRVLAARTPHIDTFGYEDLLRSLLVTFVDDPVAMAGARVFSKERGTQSAPAAAAVAGRAKAWLKRMVIEGLTPDTAVLTVRRMRRAAQEIVASDPDMTVITSGPPHSIHLVGSWLKRRFPSIYWLADYRDSWNGSSLFRKNNAALQKLNEYFERHVLGKCDGFTYISQPMLGKAAAYGGESLRKKARLIANGFDAALLEQFPVKRAEPGLLRLGYFGAIDDGKDSYRNPQSIFKAIEHLPHLPIRIEFYGAINISEEWQRRLGDRILVGPRLTHQEVFEKMSEMDGLLLLHTREDGADEVVTGKVFEYIASRLPIVSIGPATMAVNMLLQGDPLFYAAVHTDLVEIAGVFGKLAELKQSNALPERAMQQVASFSRERQFATLLDAIQARRIG